MEDRRFNNDAKSIVDALFDTKCFKEDVSRDHMNKMQELVAFMLKSNFESYVKITDLQKRLKKP